MRDFDEDTFDDEAPTNPDARSMRPRVLVVEDDEMLRELITSRMKREAFEVVEARSGFEAVELLAVIARGDAPDDLDLVVIDIRIPGVSGLEIARMLRASDWPIPVVLMTGFPDAEVITEARRLEVALLAKPFPLDRLSDAVITDTPLVVLAQDNTRCR